MFVDLTEFPCFYAVLAWPDHEIVLQIKAKQFYDQVMQELGKNREIQLNQQTIRCQVLADMIKIWSCLIFIKLYYEIKTCVLLLKSRFSEEANLELSST